MKPRLFWWIVPIAIAGGVVFYLQRHGDEVAQPRAPVIGESEVRADARAIPESQPDDVASGAASVRGRSVDFRSLPDQAKASLILGMGDDFHGHGTLIAYFLHLEERVARGDGDAVLPLAQLFRTCALRADMVGALDDPADPAHLTARACAGLPPRNGDYDRELIAREARRGVESAVIAELAFAPLQVAYSRDMSVRSDWARDVLGRLGQLSNKGNVEAHWGMANAYLAQDFGVRDLSQAARYFRRFLDSAPTGDPRQVVARGRLIRICSSGQLDPDALRACG